MAKGGGLSNSVKNPRRTAMRKQAEVYVIGPGAALAFGVLHPWLHSVAAPRLHSVLKQTGELHTLKVRSRSALIRFA
jgi:hypothetical protein